MGDLVPLGYDVIDRRLEVNQSEAQTVPFGSLSRPASYRGPRQEPFSRGSGFEKAQVVNGHVEATPVVQGNIHRLFGDLLRGSPFPCQEVERKRPSLVVDVSSEP